MPIIRTSSCFPLRKDQEDSDPTVRALAAATLTRLGAGYERELSLSPEMDTTYLFFPGYPLKGKAHYMHPMSPRTAVA